MTHPDNGPNRWGGGLLDPAQVTAAMKALEITTAQREDDPDQVSVERVVCRLVGLPDGESERVGAILEREIARIGSELLPHYRRYGMEPTTGNLLAIGMLQGVTFSAAIADLREGRTIEGD